MRAFESGGGFAETFKTSLEASFKTMVLRPMVSAVMTPISGAVNAGVNAAGSWALQGMFGKGATASTIGKEMGAGFSSTVGGWFGETAAVDYGTGSAFAGSGTAAGTATAGTTTAATTLGSAVPYIAAFIVAVNLLKGGGYVDSLGSSQQTFNPDGTFTTKAQSFDRPYGGGLNAAASSGYVDQDGNLINPGQSAGAALNAAADKLTAGFNTTYQKVAQSLGVTVATAQFGYGVNNSDGGKISVSGKAGAGLGAYDSGEVKISDTTLELEASRAIFAALRDSKMPAYLIDIFNSIDVSTATQAQIDSTLQYAQALKTVRESLLETRAYIDILKDSVSTGLASLGTSAATFKVDFVAAIDKGLTPEALQRWQALAKTMDDLTGSNATLDAAAKNVHSATRKVTADLMGFAGKVADAAKAIASAETTISDGYWTAFDARQSAEQRVIDLTWEAAKATYAYAKTIDDFLNSLDGAKSTQSLQSLKATLSTTATLASGGDKSSQDALTGQAQKVIDASKASARTQTEYLRSEAFVRSTLQGVRNTLTKAADASTANIGKASETDPMLLAQRELVKASKDYAEWLVVATAAGVSTEEGTRKATSAANDALTAWAAAVTAGKKAQEEFDIALSMVKGRHLEFSTSLRSLQDDLDALDVATKAYTDLGGRIDSLRFDGVFDAAAASIDGASGTLFDGVGPKLLGTAATVFDGTAESLAAAAAAVFGDSTVPGTAAHNAAMAADGIFGDSTDAASAAGKIAAAATVLSGNLATLLTEAQKTEIATKFTGTAEQAALLSAAMLSAKATLDADSTKVFTDATANIDAASTTLAGILTGVLTDEQKKTITEALTDTGTSAGGLATLLKNTLTPEEAKTITNALTGIGTSADNLAEVFRGTLTETEARTINESLTGTGTSADDLAAVFRSTLTEAEAKTINDALTGTGLSTDELTKKMVGKDGLSTSINSLSDLLVDDKGIYGNLGLLSTAVGGTKTAIDSFQKLLSGINFSTQGNPAGLSLPELEVNTVYRAAFGRDAEKAGLDYWTAQNLHGKALFDAITANAIDGTSIGGGNDIAARKRILGFAVGTNYVPRDMTARIHEGEAIVPKAYNPAAGARQSDNNALIAELVAETRALRAEVAALRKAADSSAKSNQTTATLLRNVMPTGDAIQVTAPDSTATVLVL
jgi:hypothetical protein